MHFVKGGKKKKNRLAGCMWSNDAENNFYRGSVHILIYTLAPKVGNFFFLALTISSMKASVLCHSALQKFPGYTYN